MNKKIENLHTTFKKYGTLALRYRQRCIGLLPEINRLRVYEEKGFGSIYEYAARLAGISNAQVDTVLRLERKFGDKPALKNALVSGEVSHHKLIRVASIATPENDEEMAEKTKQLPQKALEVLVRDEKRNGNPEPLFGQKSLRAQTLELDEDVEKELSELQEKGIDINQELRRFLKKRKREIEEEKEQLSCNATPTKSKYIKVGIRKVLRAEHGTKCSVPGCNKDAEVIHHTRRFALSGTHDPKYLASLCKEHHQIAHSIDTKYRQKLKL